ncbi:MAG: RNA methyltransferase [Rikenellaceae bacterium]
MENTENKHSIEWYQQRIDYLKEFALPERCEKLKSILEERTDYMTICTENTFHPQNASALVRNCEAFGIQNINTVEVLCKFRPNVNIVKGTDKWIDLHRHKSSTEMISSLKAQGYRIVATTPHINDTTPESFDVTKGKFALVFGTEHAGISEEVIESADEFIKIPMCGFVESLNVSASAAILLYMLSRKVREGACSWQLDELTKAEILYRWMLSSVKDSERILAKRF